MNIINSISSVPTMTTGINRKETTPVIKQENNKDILDIFSERVVKRKDITDTVTVPRNIFKGYLCFTAGTALNAISGMLKQNKFSKTLGIAGSLVAIFGTYNFVKSFLVKNENNDLTDNKK